MLRKKTSLLMAVLFFALNHSMAQNGLSEGECTSGLAYFDKYKDGYIIMKDGTRKEGVIELNDFDKSGRIKFTDQSGTRYDISVSSLKQWGLSVETPYCRSPLSWFDWKNKKRRENDHPERGLVQLKSGELLDGKIRIEGESYDGDIEDNFFALNKLTFYDNSGRETEYNASQVKMFGRIMPWVLTPSDLYQWQSGEFFGKRKTKWMPGFCITNDGRRIDGEMQLIVKNKLETRNGKGEVVNANIRNNIVDDIKFRHDGKDEKISMDDIFAYGLSGMTMKTLTNNGDRIYNFDEMNFHEGTVVMKDKSTKKGYFAYFPEPNNYYGIYFAQKADEPVTIIPMKDIESATQDIAQIEAFDDGTTTSGSNGSPRSNNNINGNIINTRMQRFDGTIRLIDDNGFWVRSIEFTDKDGRVMKYGGADGERIFSFSYNNNVYIQHGSPFMKAEKAGPVFAAYNNPFPDNTSFADKMAMELGKAVIAGVIYRTSLAIQFSTNSYMKDGTVNGKKYNNAFEFSYNLGLSTADKLMGIISKSGSKNQKDPYRSTRGEDMLIVNLQTGESIRAKNDNDVEVLLESCSEYWGMDKSARKSMAKAGAVAIADYLNNSYSN